MVIDPVTAHNYIDGRLYTIRDALNRFAQALPFDSTTISNYRTRSSDNLLGAPPVHPLPVDRKSTSGWTSSGAAGRGISLNIYIYFCFFFSRCAHFFPCPGTRVSFRGWNMTAAERGDRTNARGLRVGGGGVHRQRHRRIYKNIRAPDEQWALAYKDAMLLARTPRKRPFIFKPTNIGEFAREISNAVFESFPKSGTHVRTDNKKNCDNLLYYTHFFFRFWVKWSRLWCIMMFIFFFP